MNEHVHEDERERTGERAEVERESSRRRGSIYMLWVRVLLASSYPQVNLYDPSSLSEKKNRPNNGL